MLEKKPPMPVAYNHKKKCLCGQNGETNQLIAPAPSFLSEHIYKYNPELPVHAWGNL